MTVSCVSSCTAAPTTEPEPRWSEMRNLSRCLHIPQRWLSETLCVLCSSVSPKVHETICHRANRRWKLGNYCPDPRCHCEIPQHEVRGMTSEIQYQAYCELSFKLFLVKANLGFCPGVVITMSNSVGVSSKCRLPTSMDVTANDVCPICFESFSKGKAFVQLSYQGPHSLNQECFQLLLLKAEPRRKKFV